MFECIVIDMECSGLTKHSIRNNNNNNNNNIVKETRELIVALRTDGKIILNWSFKK
jgi:hypothetical protein